MPQCLCFLSQLKVGSLGTDKESNQAVMSRYYFVSDILNGQERILAEQLLRSWQLQLTRINFVHEFICKLK